MRVSLETLGCKLNQAESEALVRQLSEAGHQVVSSVDSADVYILNTCTITHIADAKSRLLLRQANRRNSKAIVVATGCYAERSPKELARLDGISLVTGNIDKSNLLSLLSDLSPFNHLEVDSVKSELLSAARTRAFVKIQDGCTKFCTYCIVPLVRGREKSIPPEQILAEINKRTTDGIQEIVLTGTEVGDYEYEGTRLSQLLEMILAETETPRIRISSLQPQEITPELLNIWQNARMCRHFHISLQSGCAATLARMKRGYTPEEYRDTLGLIRDGLPDTAITTDIIAGFPGETEVEFAESLRFCAQMGFFRMHVFPYSKREGTRAAKAPGQVKEELKKERVRKLMTLADKCSTDFQEKYVGRTMSVLWEHQVNGACSGYTDNYIRVHTQCESELYNRITPVKLLALTKDGICGQVMDANE